MFIWTCIIGKVDMMLFRNYAADILLRTEVIDQPGSFPCAPNPSKNCLWQHCSFAPPGQGVFWRQVTCQVNFKVFSGLYTFPAKGPAKLYNLKTCREKYHGINFSKSLSQTLLRFRLQEAEDKVLLPCLPMRLSMENLTGNETLILKRWCGAFCGYRGVETEQKAKDCACVYRGASYNALYEEGIQVTLPLFSTLIRPHLDYCVQLCYPQHNKDMDLLDWIPPKGILQDS